MAKESQTQSNYDFIASKIQSMKAETYPALRKHPDSYVFSALCVKAHFYKNPALDLDENDLKKIVVDSQRDGGADILLTDPNSEESDLVIGQSKFYTNISNEDVLNAMKKMASFYKDMIAGRYEQVNKNVASRFMYLNAETGDEAKIHFVFYTSAPKGSINRERIEEKFKEEFTDSGKIEVSILFDSDIVEEIKESESRRPTVEHGKILIDETDNYLEYGEDAVIVNVSAFSIKQLYAQHSTNLLSRNLRYHITGRDVDKGIANTINTKPDHFWFRNNGLTILCDKYEIDGKEVKLWNFSIINGGQTTFAIHKNGNINEAKDLFLPCKIIKTLGETEDEKNIFSLEIAKATNSQKAIKPGDLRANAPEQIRFAQAMRGIGVFYQTKRGEEVPKQYKSRWLNSNLMGIGKLCLAGIFQLPCTSRSKPSSLYLDKYYEPIFNGNLAQIAQVCKELLYIDHYFRDSFCERYVKENKEGKNPERISFANNARTICIAFASLAARYHQGNIKDTILTKLENFGRSESEAESLYKIFRELGKIQTLFPKKFVDNPDLYDKALNILFSAIIHKGTSAYLYDTKNTPSLTAANYLKKDVNYYTILSFNWDDLKEKISEAFQC